MSAYRPSDSIRDWATRRVQNVALRRGLKGATHLYARARGGTWSLRHPAHAFVRNVYAASPPKAGSQWMKALLDHPEVRSRSQMFTLPQTAYGRQRRRGFPAGTFVPGVYMGREAFASIPQFGDFRVVYTFRDPYDLVVSGFRSAIETHRPMRGWMAAREELKQLPEDAAITRYVELFAPRLREMESWVGVADDRVLTLRLEDIGRDPIASMSLILGHCGIVLDEESLQAVAQDVSRERLQKRDLAHRPPGSESHYRVNRETWQSVLSAHHIASIEAIVPGLRSRLGYVEE